MSDKIDCPACKRPTTIAYGDWCPVPWGERYHCPNCGAELDVETDSMFDGESSYPVTTLKVAAPREPEQPRPDYRAIELEKLQREIATGTWPLGPDQEPPHE